MRIFQWEEMSDIVLLDTFFSKAMEEHVFYPLSLDVRGFWMPANKLEHVGGVEEGCDLSMEE